MSADSVIERIAFLDAERLEIEEAIPKAPDNEVFRWLIKRKRRNIKTVYAMYEILAAVKYEEV